MKTSTAIRLREWVRLGRPYQLGQAIARELEKNGDRALAEQIRNARPTCNEPQENR